MKYWVVLLLLCSGCSTLQNQTPTVTTPPLNIGWIGPLSGAEQEWGRTDLAELQTYLQETAQAIQIDLHVQDGQCDSTKANIAAHKLIHLQKVSALISLCSESIDAIAPMAQEQHIPLFGITKEARAEESPTFSADTSVHAFLQLQALHVQEKDTY